MNKKNILKNIKYSIIIPVFNEETNIAVLIQSLKKIMLSLKESYEIIFVNDGSQDGTLNILQDFSCRDKNISIINFKVNKGQGKALEEGFRAAKGEIILSMDGDLQNDPADIPKLINKINIGFDLVCGWRHSRSDRLIKKIKSKIGNFLQKKITGLNIHDISCTMRAYNKDIVKDIILDGKFDFSFIPCIIYKKKKAKITEVKIKDNYRKFGKTKYRTLRTISGTIYNYIRLLLTNKI
jgi:glycosyltransferase involved in cell wall biosynthesis